MLDVTRAERPTEVRAAGAWARRENEIDRALTINNRAIDELQAKIGALQAQVDAQRAEETRRHASIYAAQTAWRLRNMLDCRYAPAPILRSLDEQIEPAFAARWAALDPHVPEVRMAFWEDYVSAVACLIDVQNAVHALHMTNIQGVALGFLRDVQFSNRIVHTRIGKQPGFRLCAASFVPENPEFEALRDRLNG
jgi:hypothetical protein